MSGEQQQTGGPIATGCSKAILALAVGGLILMLCVSGCFQDQDQKSQAKVQYDEPKPLTEEEFKKLQSDLRGKIYNEVKRNRRSNRRRRNFIRNWASRIQR